MVLQKLSIKSMGLAKFRSISTGLAVSFFEWFSLSWSLVFLEKPSWSLNFGSQIC